MVTFSLTGAVKAVDGLAGTAGVPGVPGVPGVGGIAALTNTRRVDEERVILYQVVLYVPLLFRPPYKIALLDDPTIRGEYNPPIVVPADVSVVTVAAVLVNVRRAKEF